MPAHVTPLTFADNDAQEIYARTAVMITDYSSVAFDVAMLNRRIVYFQFDRDDVLGGAHLGRTGYFDYERDGLGPVAADLAEVERAIVESIAGGPQASPEYQARIDRMFLDRDGKACARVVAAVEDLGRPYRRRTPDHPRPDAGGPAPVQPTRRRGRVTNRRAAATRPAIQIDAS